MFHEERPSSPSIPSDAAADSTTLRRLACCDAEPMCVLCPLRPENAERSLQELAAAGLKGNLKDAGLP